MRENFLKLNFMIWEGEDDARYKLEDELAKRGITIPEEAHCHCGRDFYLRRFLRARDLDVEKAIEMILKNLDWREENDVDTVLDRSLPEEVSDIISHRVLSYYCGHDKLGNPVYVEHTAAIPFDEILEHCTVDDLIMAHIQLQEYQHKVVYSAASKRSGMLCCRTTNILDLRGLGISMFTSTVRDIIARISAVNQENYPEGLHACYIVNAPWAFSAVYSFVKPFLNENTIKKIKILGYGEDMWKEVREDIGDGLQLTEAYLTDAQTPLPDTERATCHRLAQNYVRKLEEDKEVKLQKMAVDVLTKPSVNVAED